MKELRRTKICLLVMKDSAEHLEVRMQMTQKFWCWRLSVKEINKTKLCNNSDAEISTSTHTLVQISVN